MNPAIIQTLPGWWLVWTSTGGRDMQGPTHWICLGSFQDPTAATALCTAFNAALTKQTASAPASAG